MNLHFRNGLELDDDSTKYLGAHLIDCVLTDVFYLSLQVIRTKPSISLTFDDYHATLFI